MDKKTKYMKQPDPYNFKETGEFIEEYLTKPKEKEEETKEDIISDILCENSLFILLSPHQFW